MDSQEDVEVELNSEEGSLCPYGVLSWWPLSCSPSTGDEASSKEDEWMSKTNEGTDKTDEGTGKTDEGRDTTDEGTNKTDEETEKTDNDMTNLNEGNVTQVVGSNLPNFVLIF